MDKSINGWISGWMDYGVGGWVVGEWIDKPTSKWKDGLVEGR